MSKVLVSESNLQDIADAIREKNGSSDTYTPGEMSTAIENIPSGGGDISEYFNTEITSNTSSNNNAVLKLVKKIPNISVANNVTSLVGAFQNYKGTTIPTISGTSNITNMQQMFSGCSNITQIPLIDTSNVNNMAYMFSECISLISIPQLNTSNVTNMMNMFQFLNTAAALTTVPKLNASNVTNISNVIYSSRGGSQTNLDSFTDFGGFENLGQAYLTTSSANYSQYTLDLKNSFRLTHDSLMNVINNLYDIATAGVQAQKLVLGSTNMAKLTAEEIAIATNKGWTVS